MNKKPGITKRVALIFMLSGPVYCSQSAMPVITSEGCSARSDIDYTKYRPRDNEQRGRHEHNEDNEGDD